MSAATRNYELLQQELLPQEEIYWVGQPDAWRSAFQPSTASALFVCIFLGVLGFTFSALLSVIFFSFLLLPVISEYLQRRSTYYAVTSLRVLMICGTQNVHASSYALHRLPGIEKSVDRNGIGMITFGLPATSRAWLHGRTNFSTGWRSGECPGFYHIREVNAVYRLLVDLRANPIVRLPRAEKPKRKRVEEAPAFQP